MTVPRSELIDVEVTRWYHLISKTVRGASLLGEGESSRKQWLEDRVEELSDIFPLEVAGLGVLDNHLHLVVRLAPELAEEWSDEEVVRRWARLHPPRGTKRKPQAVTDKWVHEQLKNPQRVQILRERLMEVGWFMKCLKEPLARLANQEDGLKGTFWQPRYKSIALLDEQALLACCMYVDLNVMAAGLVEVPEQSPHTSLRARVQHCAEQGRLKDLQAARKGSVIAAQAAKDMEQGLWLCPLEDRRAQGARRPGLLEGLSLGSYLMLIDWTSRLLRPGKAHVDSDVPPILDRLGTTGQMWQTVMQRMFDRERQQGVAFAFHRERLAEAAVKRGRHHLANLNGCPT